MEQKPKRRTIALLGGKRATDSKGQKSTKAATAVVPSIYFSSTLTQEPQAIVHNGHLRKNFKDRAIWSAISPNTPFLK